MSIQQITAPASWQSNASNRFNSRPALEGMPEFGQPGPAPLFQQDGCSQLQSFAVQLQYQVGLLDIFVHIAERSGLQEVKYTDKAGASRKRIHPHQLRHSFAMWSLDSGVPIYDLQKQLGHASLAATGIYLEASPNHRKESYLKSKVVNCLTR